MWAENLRLIILCPLNYPHPTHPSTHKKYRIFAYLLCFIYPAPGGLYLVDGGFVGLVGCQRLTCVLNKTKSFKHTATACVMKALFLSTQSIYSTVFREHTVAGYLAHHLIFLEAGISFFYCVCGVTQSMACSLPIFQF